MIWVICSYEFKHCPFHGRTEKRYGVPEIVTTKPQTGRHDVYGPFQDIESADWCRLFPEKYKSQEDVDNRPDRTVSPASPPVPITRGWRAALSIVVIILIYVIVFLVGLSVLVLVMGW